MGGHYACVFFLKSHNIENTTTNRLIKIQIENIIKSGLEHLNSFDSLDMHTCESEIRCGNETKKIYMVKIVFFDKTTFKLVTFIVVAFYVKQ